MNCACEGKLLAERVRAFLFSIKCAYGMCLRLVWISLSSSCPSDYLYVPQSRRIAASKPPHQRGLYVTAMLAAPARERHALVSPAGEGKRGRCGGGGEDDFPTSRKAQVIPAASPCTGPITCPSAWPRTRYRVGGSPLPDPNLRSLPDR
jgi:hypothetical protein